MARQARTVVVVVGDDHHPEPARRSVLEPGAGPATTHRTGAAAARCEHPAAGRTSQQGPPEQPVCNHASSESRDVGTRRGVTVPSRARPALVRGRTGHCCARPWLALERPGRLSRAASMNDWRRGTTDRAGGNMGPDRILLAARIDAVARAGHQGTGPPSRSSRGASFSPNHRMRCRARSCRLSGDRRVSSLGVAPVTGGDPRDATSGHTAVVARTAVYLGHDGDARDSLSPCRAGSMT